MAESTKFISLGNVNFYTYSLLEVLMYLVPVESLEFLFTVNRQTRSFLKDNYRTLDRGFENEGLKVKHINMLKGCYIYEILKFLYKICA